MAAIKKDNWARALGFGALLVSLVSLFISSRTYFLSERPYLGITKVEDRFESGDSSSPSRIRWAIVFKNTGNLPAVGTVVLRKVTVTHDQKVHEVPLRYIREASISVMPGGEVTLYGDVPENEHVPLALIKAGKASITDVVRLSYEPTRAVIWKSQYFYEAKLHYVGGPGPAYFTSQLVDAD
jgi:hypothetical protein